ncbi:MAG TPA: type II toxin-antitoxin system VapC family toxin [Bryobacteraceae bacterium]|nr:type II toxin-antitoxin system VapC family toxin [Bryobacteraceae bacterium]
MLPFRTKRVPSSRIPANTIVISAVSLWEIWLKNSLGKLHIRDDFERRLDVEPFDQLPLRAAHTRRVALLEWHHRDPFDRMLVAQAQLENLALLTCDEVIPAYGSHVRLVN